MSDFYKHIYEHGDSYQIIKNGESFGTYNKLTDALYERDRLIENDWDIVASAESDETENFYEKMQLPRFIHEHDYIYRICNSFEVYVGDELKGRFKSKIDAFEFAQQVGGTIYEASPRFRIQKSVKGKQKSFGSYKTLEEAQRKRDKLIKRGWKK